MRVVARVGILCLALYSVNAYALPSIPQLVSQWGHQGNEEGAFFAVMAIAVGPDGSVYAADSAGRILKFSTEGEFLLQWGSRGSADGQFQTPTGIAVSRSGDVYVCEYHGNRIQVFDQNGQFLRKWGTPGMRPGQFNGPEKIALDQEGNVYVTDTGNFRIEKFTASGRFQRAWGRRGAAPGEFTLPVGIAVSPHDQVYVADVRSGGIQIFSADGTFISRLGTGPGTVPEPKIIWSRKRGQGSQATFGMGEVPRMTSELAKTLCDSSLHKPGGIAIDSVGTLYVVNRACDRVQKYNRQGSYIGGWWIDVRPTHLMERVGDIALGRGGDVYVTEMNGPTVRKFGFGQVRADRVVAALLGTEYLGMLDSLIALPFGDEVMGKPGTSMGSLRLNWAYLGFHHRPTLVGATREAQLRGTAGARPLPAALADVLGRRLGKPLRLMDAGGNVPDSARYESAGIEIRSTISRRREGEYRIVVERKSPSARMATVSADTCDLRLLEGGLTEPDVVWESVLRGLMERRPDLATGLVTGKTKEEDLLKAVQDAARPGVSEADRDLVLLAADRWLRSRGTSGTLVALGAPLGESWSSFGFHSSSDGNADVYCGSILEDLASRAGRNEWADLAYLLLLDQGWVTDCSGDFEGADFGNDLFAPVIKRGEAFLKARPRADLWPSIALRVALAHETVWSLAKSPDPFRDWTRVGAQHQRRALELYRKLIPQTKDVGFRRALERRVRNLEQGRDTKCRVYYLEGEC